MPLVYKLTVTLVKEGQDDQVIGLANVNLPIGWELVNDVMLEHSSQTIKEFNTIHSKGILSIILGQVANSITSSRDKYAKDNHIPEG